MKSGNSQLLRIYLTALFWAMVFSGLGQILIPREIAKGSQWGFAPGWQREIGFFDLAFGIVILFAVKSGEVRCSRGVLIATIALTALIGTNHLVAILTGPPSWVHLVFVAVNFAFVAFGCSTAFSNAR